MPRRCTRVRLDVEVGSDPIAGHVSVGAAAPEPFSGWIELVERIEHARSPEETGGDHAAPGAARAGAQTPGGSPGAKPAVL